MIYGGLCDASGLAADGNLDNFIDCITPELKGKFLVYLSTSAGLKFSGIHSGFAAALKGLAVEWLQFVICVGLCDVSGWSA